MSNIEIEDFNMAGFVIKNPEYETAKLQFPGADTYVVGTILARKEVNVAIVVTADAGNTGDGTVTAVVDSPNGNPKVGNYNVECIETVVNGGIFKIENPDGALVLGNVAIDVPGAGKTAVVTVDGITFTITDGSTDFASGDIFLCAVVADGDWVIFDADGVAGAQIPRGILPVEEVATQAADVPTRVLIKGTVRTDKLVIDAGDTVTDAIKDKLRDFSIICLDTTDLSIEDND